MSNAYGCQYVPLVRCFSVLRAFWMIVFVLISGILGGCSVVQSGKMLWPESFGLTKIAPNVYVEKDTDETLKINLREARDQAEKAIHAAYGSVRSRPNVHACITEKCFEALGGRGEMAKVFGDQILLSPRTLNWHLIAHEWSHAELSTRLTFLAWKRMPQWFDEGVAVAISEAPEHSENQWRYLVDANIARPTREELHTFKSLRKWIDAVHRYGDGNNIERKAIGETEIRPVYSAAGHELRPWLAKEGSAGLLQFIDQMNKGMDFDAIYHAVDEVNMKAAPRADAASAVKFLWRRTSSNSFLGVS